MDRRTLVTGMGALATLTVAGGSRADNHKHDAQHEHMHAHHHGQGATSPLAEAAGHCLRTGEVCLNHCLDLLAQGDKEMAICGKAVNELIAVCATLQKLAATESKFLAKYAKLAAEVCENCEKECRKHEKKHRPCRDCAEACAACLKECRKFAA